MTESVADGPPSEPGGADDEAALWLALKQERSRDARERLFVLHAPLALRVAKKCFYAWGGGDVELADLRQLASAGLLEAIDSYDPAKAIPFRAFAYRRVRGSVLDGLAKASEMQEQLAARRRARRERLASLRAGWRNEKTEPLQALVEAAVGLALGFMLEGAALYRDDKADEPSVTAYDHVAWRETLDRLRTELKALSQREQSVILHHYEGALSFEQIGALLGVTKGRVSQIHKAAITKLRERMAPNDPDSD